MPKVLLLEPNEDIAKLIRTSLGACNICMDHASSMPDATKYLSQTYRVVVADYKMNNGVTGINYARIFQAKNRDIKTIVYNHDGNESSGNEISKVFKSFDMREIVEAIKIYCISGIEPEIIETLFCEIKKIKEKVESFGDLKKTVDAIEKSVKDFIGSHKNDAWKIVLAIGGIEAARLAISKIFHLG